MSAPHFEQIKSVRVPDGPAHVSCAQHSDQDQNCNQKKLATSQEQAAPSGPAAGEEQTEAGSARKQSKLASWLTITPEIETRADMVLPDFWMDQNYTSERACDGTQVEGGPKNEETSVGLSTSEAIEGSARDSKNKFDRALDWCVVQSGSIPIFIITQALLWIWVFLAIPYHLTNAWQVVISDAQAIYSYALDSVIMHQQLDDLDISRYINGQLQSRNDSKLRMVHELQSKNPELFSTIPTGERISVLQPDGTHHKGPLIIDGEMIPELPKETWPSKTIRQVSMVVGHLGAVMVFWAGFVVWIATGPSNGWSDLWQLYYNGACSGYMVMIFSLLTVTGETYAKYRRACLAAIKGLDRAIERELRFITKDRAPNPTKVLRLTKSTPVQSVIAGYAYIVGTLIGLVLLVIVIVVWICVGPALHFNANWWLIIGTYAGLIGLHDSFVLRHMQMRCDEWQTPWTKAVVQGDEDLAQIINPQSLAEDRAQDKQEAERLAHRLFHQRWTQSASDFILKVCAHEWAVVADVLFIIALIAASSALKWSVTGQLICNNPPGILESFLMQILITGLNAADAQEQKQLKRMYDRRVDMLGCVRQWRGRLCHVSYDDDDEEDSRSRKRRGSDYHDLVANGPGGTDEISVLPDLTRD